MQMENNSMGGLSPEARQRLRDALQTLEANGGFANMTQGYNRRLTDASQWSTRHNQAWAHWEYNPDEWAFFDKIDWEPARNRSRLGLLLSPVVCLGLIGVILAIEAVVFHFATDGFFALAYILALFLVMGMVSWMVSAASVGKKAKARYLARRNPLEPYRVTFSKEGIWEAGTFFPLKSRGVKLKSVRLTFQPPILHFTDSNRQIIRVLVPRGFEAEAELLRRGYDAEVINAKPRTYTPPEPL